MTIPGRRWRHLLLDGPERAAVAMLGLAITLWGIPARGPAAWDLISFGLALGYGCIVAGRLVVGALRLPMDRFGDLPTVILVGFLALSLLLLAAALALPLPLVADALVIAAGLIAWAARAAPPSRRPPAAAPGLACLALSLAAAGLWSVDSIDPIVVDRDVVIFKPWGDGYTHACFIRLFREARGVAAFEHYSMAGERAPMYHYAGFLVPALLTATTGSSCYLAFTTFMVPFGMALTGLAAFALVRGRWGPGAGLAAALGVLLLPDASRYGIADPYLGYFWLAQNGPTNVYGIAMIAVAWALVSEGCRAGRPALVAAGFAAAGATVAFKAHLFVANAFPLWIYPALFLRGVSRRGRWIWLAAAVATFAIAVRASWQFPAVPLLKLNGSGLRAYVGGVANLMSDGGMRRLLAVEATTPRPVAVLKGLVLLTFGTLGAFAVLFPVLAALLIRRGRAGADGAARVEAATFPFLVTGNYLIMALGLAFDDRTQHMPDELRHRPLVWAYFAVAAWTLGCCREVLPRPWVARLGPARRLVPVAVVGLLGVPLWLGPGVQVGPGWGREVTRTPQPAGLVRCAEFLRDHAGRGEVVQGSAGDPWIILGALAERRVYVADTWRVAGRQTHATIRRRLDEMADFRRLADPAAIAAFAARRRIAWYVLDPATPVAWPASVLDRPAFESGGFRVYHLAPAG